MPAPQSPYAYGVRRRSTPRRLYGQPEATLVQQASLQRRASEQQAAQFASLLQQRAPTSPVPALSPNSASQLSGFLNLANKGRQPSLGDVKKAMRGRRGGGGGGGGDGLLQHLRGAKSSQQLWNRIGSFRGGLYDIGGVHHDEGAYERDINVQRGKLRPAGEGVTSPQERKHLRILARALNRLYGKRRGVEIIFDPWGSQFGAGRNKRPYGGHKAHLHMSTSWF